MTATPLRKRDDDRDDDDRDDDDAWEDLSETVEDDPTFDSDDDDDEEEEDESSIWEDLTASWRQHGLALLVAIVAAFAAHSHVGTQRREGGAGRSAALLHASSSPVASSSSPTTANRVADAPPLLRHAHLVAYERTANVSFCGGDHLAAGRSGNDGGLETMDFTLDKRLVGAMRVHFAADWLQRDDAQYAATVLPAGAEVEHPQAACLERLARESSQPYVRGVTFYYRDPSLESVYRLTDNGVKGDDGPSVMKRKGKPLRVAHLSFTGFAAKFVNLSPRPVLLHWDGRGGHEGSVRLVGEIGPFAALSTATTPGQSFSVSPVHDASHALARWVVTADEAVVYYEPPDNSQLSKQEELLYQMQLINRDFAKHYQAASGRTWLSTFPRAFPVHPMWPADYLGQTHLVKDGEQSYTLTVASVRPRVLTIDNFLATEECRTLIALAAQQGFSGSTVYAGGAQRHSDRRTRSSTNAWLERGLAPLTDEIYRRAATVLRLDESLLTAPIDDDVKAHHHSMAESLQVIRYGRGEEYAPHHDWVLPPDAGHRHQPTRFATLLLYLNDDFGGGHTVFPRAVQAERHDGVRVEPVRGRAVLFYNMLPDGNVDDLSQHSSEPVESGEKFAANLWLWEPMIN